MGTEQGQIRRKLPSWACRVNSFIYATIRGTSGSVTTANFDYRLPRRLVVVAASIIVLVAAECELIKSRKKQNASRRISIHCLIDNEGRQLVCNQFQIKFF
jgi:hypothetical protein